MKRVLSGFLVALCLSWLLPDPVSAQRQKRPPRSRNREGNLKVGQKAPTFTLQGVDGKTSANLAESKGKPTILIFGSCT